MLKRRLTALAITAALAGGAATVAPAPAVAKPCSAGWTHAVVSDGSHKCLRAGQYCATRHERQYRAKGYTCKGGRLKRK